MNKPYQVGPGPGVEPADADEARGALGLVGRDLAGPAAVPRGVARLGGGERGPTTPSTSVQSAVPYSGTVSESPNPSIHDLRKCCVIRIMCIC